MVRRFSWRRVGSLSATGRYRKCRDASEHLRCAESTRGLSVHFFPFSEGIRNRAIERRHRGTERETSWGLQLGSKIVWLVNDHQRGTREQPSSLLNGALGFVTSVGEEALVAHFDDGSEHRLRRSDLGKLERGWAISIHKAQGSAFRCVVVPIVSSGLLDRALVYTAVTRATDTVILVGDEALLAAAIAKQSAAYNRRVGLRFGIP